MAACGTQKNPAATCMQGTCIDPSFPYCDTDGSVAGTPGACIAVTCTAGEFGKCVGDSELMCNQYGTGYDQVDCAHGCDENTGCKLCEANQTVCSNGAVASCDAAGNQTSVKQCPLGCFNDEPRCRDIDPSNRLGPYLDMVMSPPDLDLSDGQWYVDLSTGIWDGPGSETVSPPMFEVPSLTGGPASHVFVVGSLKIKDLGLAQSSAATLDSVTFLASGPVEIAGSVILDPTVGSTHKASCQGQSGYRGNEQFGPCTYLSPGGGGGASKGGNGGTIVDADPPVYKMGGAAYGTDDLQPLVGGCSGGGGLDPQANTNYTEGMPGGGAIQISSRVAITIKGSIHADGRDGDTDSNRDCDEVWLGAGGGGGILLEAPSITLAPNAVLSAVGGNGIGCDPATALCGAFGHGGTGSSSATDGGDAVFMTALGRDAQYRSGSGGGGVGRVRLNTKTAGSYTSDGTSKIDAALTTGAIGTR